MNYIDYKNLAKQAIDSENMHAIAYFFSTADKLINARLLSFKYKHCDLSKKEHKILLKLNNLNEDDILIGGEVHRVVGDIKTKKLILTKVDEIELFTILHQINWIKTQNINT